MHFPGYHQGAHSANKDFLRFRFGVLEILKSLEIIVTDSSLDFFLKSSFNLVSDSSSNVVAEPLVLAAALTELDLDFLISKVDM